MAWKWWDVGSKDKLQLGLVELRFFGGALDGGTTHIYREDVIDQSDCHPQRKFIRRVCVSCGRWHWYHSADDANFDCGTYIRMEHYATEVER